MLIPVKCFTCGKVLADKYEYYKNRVKLRKMEKGEHEDSVNYLTKVNKEKTPEGLTMDELYLNKICCRRHFLTHVDIE
tara:strand:+ start:4598 stop:4831 length:234 start_codon:yes stop_codon:yes gene_type:complete